MSQYTRRDFVTHTAASSAALWAATHAPTAAAKGKLGAVYDEIERRHDETVARLQEWIKQPSISAENIGMQEGAELMKKLALDAGFQQAEIIATKGHPGVFATLDAGAKHTLGLYFMYDVKQADPAEWSSPPWDAKLLDMPGMGTVLMGRGATNQKGPQAAFLAALHAIRGAGKKMPVNLVLVAEGEEEVGSPNFPQIVPRHAARPRRARKMHRHLHAEPRAGKRRQRPHHPRLQGRHRVRPRRDRRGLGPRSRARRALEPSPRASTSRPGISSRRSTRSSRPTGDPAIDGFFEHVRPVSAEERAMLDTLAKRLDENAVKEAMGVKTWARDANWRQALEDYVSRPTVTIEGLVGGYTGPGGKTILPTKMTAKLDMRLVPDMTPEDIVPKLKAHLAKRGFGDIEVVTSTAAGTTPHRRRRMRS